MKIEINKNYKEILREIERMSDIKKIISGKRVFIEENNKLDLIELVEIERDKTVVLAYSMNLLRDELTESSKKVIERIKEK